MTLTYLQVHRHRHLISRTFYGAPGSVGLVVPAKAAYLRVSMVGAGGASANFQTLDPPGGGGAFARKLQAVTPGDAYTLQIGDHAHALGTGDSAGDTILTKNVGGTVICKATRGLASGPGLASNCVGDTKRSGQAATYRGGMSGSDLTDTFSLGFGGRGAVNNGATADQSAGPGGGGFHVRLVYASPDDTYHVNWTQPPGDGRACVEWFDRNPTTSWPGYGG